MKIWRIAFFVTGLLCIGFCATIFSQNVQAFSLLANVINVIFIVLGVVINFIQLFFLFPLVNKRADEFFVQISSHLKEVPQSYLWGSLSRGSRYLLRMRGFCYIVLGIYTVIPPTANPYDPYSPFFLWGMAVFLAGMATISMALQEWDASRKRRWFLLEGIVGSLVGLLFLLFSAVSTQRFPAYYAEFLLESWFLSYLMVIFPISWVLWAITASFGEIRGSNGWALTAGGVLSLIMPIVLTVGTITISAVFHFPLVLFACYSILFGITSIIGSFQ